MGNLNLALNSTQKSKLCQNNGVPQVFRLIAQRWRFASAGQRLMALAKAFPPPILDLGAFSETPIVNSYGVP